MYSDCGEAFSENVERVVRIPCDGIEEFVE